MAPPPVGRSSPTASPAPAPPPHHSLPLQRFRHQRHQHDLGAAVLGGFAEPEVIRARGDFRVCLDEVVGDLEAIGRRVGKGGHLRVPDFPPQLVVLVGTKGVDVHDVRLHPRGQCHLDSGVIFHALPHSRFLAVSITTSSSSSDDSSSSSPALSTIGAPSLTIPRSPSGSPRQPPRRRRTAMPGMGEPPNRSRR